MDPVGLCGLIAGCILLPSILIACWYCDRMMCEMFDRWEEQANKEMEKETLNAD